MTTAKQGIRDQPGRVVHDARGNAVWQPGTEVRSENTLHVLLNTDELTLLENGAAQAGQHGFDPYGRDVARTGSGAPAAKTDLRALSAQILAERERGRKPG